MSFPCIYFTTVHPITIEQIKTKKKTQAANILHYLLLKAEKMGILNSPSEKLHRFCPFSFQCPCVQGI